ncbi:MAG: hypothetical protein ACTSQZ_10180 [Candidatus Thorarchaeota archaeon]
MRKRILERIAPTNAELETQHLAISALREELENFANKISQPYSFIEPQGSTGKKQTQLRNAGDIDLFIALNPKDYTRTLALALKARNSEVNSIVNGLVDDWLIPVVKTLKITDYQKTYSQHPYLSCRYMDIETDIIICFDISAQRLEDTGPITAVDRTIHHTEYVSKHLTSNQRDDVRILKSFARACHAYGDACAVGRMGFTGYSLELLIIENNNFQEALSALRNLIDNPIDPLNRSIETLQNIPAFRDDHLFIIDPTDTNRNVASSFDERTYRWLRTCIDRIFASVKNGDVDEVISSLVERPIPSDLPPTWVLPHIVTYQFKSDGTQHYTILRDKLYRLGRKIITAIEKERGGERRFGNSVFEVYFENDMYALGIFSEVPQILSHYPRKGPPLGLEKAEKEFRSTHSSVYEKNGFLWVDEKRRWTKLSEAIQHIVSKNPIEGLERVIAKDLVSERLRYVILKYILREDNPIRKARV